MNTAIHTILTRKSIRKFTEEPVSKEAIDLLLTVAMQSPSACNQQPWHFVVINEKSVLQEISSMHSGISFAKGAPNAILVCGEPGKTIMECYWRDDCANASQSILLAAHALGLGATWSGVTFTDTEYITYLQDTFAIPKQFIPYSLIVFGHPDDDTPVNSRFDAGRIHYGKW